MPYRSHVTPGDMSLPDTDREPIPACETFICYDQYVIELKRVLDDRCELIALAEPAISCIVADPPALFARSQAGRSSEYLSTVLSGPRWHRRARSA